MTAYISVSFSKRKLAGKAITAIVDTPNKFKISSFVFVDQYSFDKQQENK